MAPASCLQPSDSNLLALELIFSHTHTKRDSLLNAATSVLGWKVSAQLGWFAEAYSVLHPLITKRNQLVQRWVETQLPEDQERIVNQCRYMAKMIMEETTVGINSMLAC